MAARFCTDFGIGLEEAESKLRGVFPVDGGGYFKEDGSRAGNWHMLYFSTISYILKNARNILEQGTGLGKTTAVLSALFPNAMIYTVDLPEDDDDYKEYAYRNRDKGNLENFKKNISKDNIVFIETNSFFLPSLKLPSKFDLIWVDGGHCYPVVAWDIMFSYNRLCSGGFLFMHDYGGVKLNVKPTIDYVNNRIEENVKFLPSIMTGGSKIAWLRKV